MADFGYELISKIVGDGDFLPALDAKVKPDWFVDKESRSVYSWMLDYFGRYGEAPTPKALKSQFPTFRLIRCEEPYEFYIDEFRLQRKRSILVETIVDIDDALKEDDPKKAENLLSQGMTRLGREVSSLQDENAVETGSKRLDRYREARANAGTLTGVDTGFPTLNFVSGGYHPQQFIVLGGQMKNCKSFIMMKSAIGAQRAGYSVLFISFEMTVYEQLARYDAMNAGVDSMRVMFGRTTDEDEKRLKNAIRSVKNLPPFIVSADISATTTVSGLSGKIEQHQPDIVFIDGMYLMDNEAGAESGSTQAYTSISRAIKRLAQRTNMPIVGSTQALPGKMKDNKVTMGSLGWTSAWAQDADLILGTEKMEDSPLVKLRVVGGRNVAPREIPLSINWETSQFEEIEDYGEDDEEEW